MADEFSFDVVSKVNLQEVEDAVNTANREITVRFDFRGSVSRFEFDKKTSEIALYADDEGKLKSVVDILQSRFAKRGIDLKCLEYKKVEKALGGAVRQAVKVNQGIVGDKAKAVVADIKSAKLKVTPSIQSDQVRVTSKSKDELQAVIQLLKQKEYGIPLQFVNFR